MIGPNGSSQPSRATPGWDLGVTAAIVLAWAGFFIHNVADLPGQTILSPESLLPTLVWLVASAMWVVPATRRAGMWTLLVWTVVNLVGGALSVLPLPIWAFEPEQSVKHYAFHSLYAVSQVPLIFMAATSLRRRDRRRTGDAT